MMTLQRFGRKIRAWWRARRVTLDNPTLDAITAKANEEALRLLVPIADALEEPDDEKMDAVQASLTEGIEWAIREKIAELDTYLQRLTAALQSAMLPERALQWLQAHGGMHDDDLHHSIGVGQDQPDTPWLARRYVEATSRLQLWLALILLMAAAVVAVIFDFEIVLALTFGGAASNKDGSIPPELYTPLLFKSACTLAGYTVASILWHWPKLRPFAVLAYGIIFSWIAAQVWPSLNPDMLWWQRLPALLLETYLYAIAGLLLIVSEQGLVYVTLRLRDTDHAAAIVLKDDTARGMQQTRGLLLQILEDRGFITRTAAAALQHASHAMHTAYVGWRDRGAKLEGNVAKQPSLRQRGREQFNKAVVCLEKIKPFLLVVLVLLGLAGCDRLLPPRPDPEASLKIPHFTIAIDGSSSSPAKDAAWVQSAFSYMIDEHIAQWPFGGFLMIIRCGDTLKPLDLGGKRIQRRTDNAGLSRHDAVLWAHDRLNEISDAIRTEPYNRSELTYCLKEIAMRFNPNSEGNMLLFITDCAEWQAATGVNCENPGKPCKLPEPDFTFPPAQVDILGCGVGFPGNHTRHLQAEFRRFLEKAGVAKDRLRIGL